MNAAETNEVVDRVLKLAAEHFKLPPDAVHPESRLREDLGADSLDFVLLAYEVEDAFGIVFPDDAVTTVRTLGDAAAVVTNARKGA